VNLKRFESRRASALSGGMKRRLSVAMALVGAPSLVLMDEPSTGLDPASKRALWNVISSAKGNKSIVLTTHSMEECEALCQRIGIMVSGRLRCLGSAQHLKSRYGSGYQLDVNVMSGDSQILFKAWILETFPDSKIIEFHGDNLKFSIPKQAPNGQFLSFAAMFRLIESVKGRYGIHEYSCSEATLEQIFINFAKQQDEEQGELPGLSYVRPGANGFVPAASIQVPISTTVG